MHKLAYGSKRIDSLYWCMQASQIDTFLDLYFEVRRKNARFAACILRQYRRRRPWLNLFFNEYAGRKYVNYCVPGGCGRYGHRVDEPIIPVHLGADILYGTMNLILMIKQRQDQPWDFWGWHDRRKASRLPAVQPQ